MFCMEYQVRPMYFPNTKQQMVYSLPPLALDLSSSIHYGLLLTILPRRSLSRTARHRPRLPPPHRLCSPPQTTTLPPTPPAFARPPQPLRFFPHPPPPHATPPPRPPPPPPLPSTPNSPRPACDRPCFRDLLSLFLSPSFLRSLLVAPPTVLRFFSSSDAAVL